jgi:hypothetical protein
MTKFPARASKNHIVFLLVPPLPRHAISTLYYMQSNPDMEFEKNNKDLQPD